jgi:hypothetical protein
MTVTNIVMFAALGVLFALYTGRRRKRLSQED